jgi:hypothetical protein
MKRSCGACAPPRISISHSGLSKKRAFFMTDFHASSLFLFQALGNLYFIRDSVTNIHIWDFNNLEFVPVVGKEVHHHIELSSVIVTWCLS